MLAGGPAWIYFIPAFTPSTCLQLRLQVPPGLTPSGSMQLLACLDAGQLLGCMATCMAPETPPNSSMPSVSLRDLLYLFSHYCQNNQVCRKLQPNLSGFFCWKRDDRDKPHESPGRGRADHPCSASQVIRCVVPGHGMLLAASCPEWTVAFGDMGFTK